MTADQDVVVSVIFSLLRLRKISLTRSLQLKGPVSYFFLGYGSGSMLYLALILIVPHWSYFSSALPPVNKTYLALMSRALVRSYLLLASPPENTTNSCFTFSILRIVQFSSKHNVTYSDRYTQCNFWYAVYLLEFSSSSALLLNILLLPSLSSAQSSVSAVVLSHQFQINSHSAPPIQFWCHSVQCPHQSVTKWSMILYSYIRCLFQLRSQRRLICIIDGSKNYLQAIC